MKLVENPPASLATPGDKTSNGNTGKGGGKSGGKKGGKSGGKNGKLQSSRAQFRWSYDEMCAWFNDYMPAPKGIAPELLDQCSRTNGFQGRVMQLAMDQAGCRMLQRKLDERDQVATNIIFNELCQGTNVIDLMTDPFGNYLCQKFVDVCSDQHRYAIISKVQPSLVAVCLNMHGTRAVQRMIEVVKDHPDQVEQLTARALSGAVVSLAKDLNGSHVIQKCLHLLEARQNDFIFNSIIENCVEVGTHRHGCCVIQRCLDAASQEPKTRLVNEIVRVALKLVVDPFGNYVVQYVIEMNNSEHISQICAQLTANLISLCCQKFSSNVVEKVLETGNVADRSMTITSYYLINF